MFNTKNDIRLSMLEKRVTDLFNENIKVNLELLSLKESYNQLVDIIHQQEEKVVLKRGRPKNKKD